MPKISVVIPHLPLNAYLENLLDDCIKALSGYDELILIINETGGYGKAFNRGFKYAKGNYIMAVSNDAHLYEGTLNMMCDPEAVTFTENAQFGCFFCLPRWVYERVGGFDERFEGAFFEDNNFLSRLARADIPLKKVEGVKVHHEGGVTVKTMGKEKEYYDKNKLIYDQIEKELDEGVSYYVPPCGNSCIDKSSCKYRHL